MNNSPRPVAFIYDRCATQHRAMLRLRLDDCRAYADAGGMEIAGEWVDEGEFALLDSWRPAFNSLIAAMENHPEREVICLVQHWDRLTRDRQYRKVLRDRVTRARGRTLTTLGETDADDDSIRITLTTSDLTP